MKTAILNLDKNFDPFYLDNPSYVLNIDFDSFKFNAGEMHIKIEPSINFARLDCVYISHRIRSSDDVFLILMAKEALVRLGVEKVYLYIPYLPYARQDRVCNYGESFSLKVFSDILNSAGFKSVICFDAHSEVSPALINNCINTSNHRFVRDAIQSIVMKKSIVGKATDKNIYVVSPDSGSNKKIKDLMKYLTNPSLKDVEGVLQGKPLIMHSLLKCDKTRDLKNGELTGFEVYADDLQGVDCVIVDDICSNGGTFLGLADELKKKNAGDLYLVCSHGEFGSNPDKTIEKLSSKFKHIYVTDSFQDIVNENVTQLKLVNMYNPF